MKNTTCLNCGKSFKARSGKLFCSGKCRTANHRKNPSEGSKQGQEILLMKAQSQSEDNFNFNFKESEVDDFIKWCKENNKPNVLPDQSDREYISVYCYFRRGFVGKVNFEQMYNILDKKFTLEFWDNTLYAYDNRFWDTESRTFLPEDNSQATEDPKTEQPASGESKTPG
jgi:hypothetical protein